MHDEPAFSQLPADAGIGDEGLAAMFDQAPGFMAMLRAPEHRIVLANKAALRLAGSEIIGKTAAEVLPPSLAQDAVRTLDEAYHGGKPLHLPAAVFPRKQRGSEEARVLDLVLQPITDATGAVSGIFIEGSDVTDRVRAEQRLRSSLAIKTVGIIYWGADLA
jgi:PAS domain S-box-containing protein